MNEAKHDVPQAIQSIPSAGAIILFFSGKDVNWWAAVLGMAFIAVQLIYVIWKFRRDIRRERQRVAASRIDETDDE